MVKVRNIRLGLVMVVAGMMIACNDAGDAWPAAAGRAGTGGVSVGDDHGGGGAGAVGNGDDHGSDGGAGGVRDGDDHGSDGGTGGVGTGAVGGGGILGGTGPSDPGCGEVTFESSVDLSQSIDNLDDAECDRFCEDYTGRRPGSPGDADWLECMRRLRRTDASRPLLNLAACLSAGSCDEPSPASCYYPPYPIA